MTKDLIQPMVVIAINALLKGLAFKRQQHKLIYVATSIGIAISFMGYGFALFLYVPYKDIRVITDVFIYPFLNLFVFLYLGFILRRKLIEKNN